MWPPLLPPHCRFPGLVAAALSLVLLGLSPKLTSSSSSSSSSPEHNEVGAGEQAAAADSNVSAGASAGACPHRCVCLIKQAYCDNISMRRLPHALPQDIITLSMHNNLVRKLTRKSFKGLHHIKHLILKGNRISYVEPTAFKDMFGMKALSLTQNSLRRLSSETFKSMVNLQVLSLRGNKLSSVEKLFYHAVSLKLLNLAENRIKQITDKTFKRNFQVTILDLHNNRIKSIHRHAFKSMPLLKYLVLRDNPLKVAEFDLGYSHHLELMDFTNCQLKEMVKGLPYSINDLRLAENKLTSISKDDFKSTKKIRLLVLNNNRIRDIEDNALSHLSQLYDVYLGGNQLRHLPKELPSSLHGLYLNYNNVSQLSRYQLTRCGKLQQLSLSHNQVHHVDSRALRGLESLQSLDLSYNHIDIVEPMTFADNTQLRKLDLSHNPLLELGQYCFHGLEHLHILQMASVATDGSLQPVVFQDTKSLMYLDVHQSPAMASHLTRHPHFITSVEDLNLMEDGLQRIPQQFVAHMSRLSMVKLGGNPWHCDAHIYPLSLWMRNNSITFHEQHLMRCVSPARLKGRLIHQLTMMDLDPPVTTHRPKVKIELGGEGYDSTNDTFTNTNTSLDIRDPKTHKITTQFKSDKDNGSSQEKQAAHRKVISQTLKKRQFRKYRRRKFGSKKKKSTKGGGLESGAGAGADGGGVSVDGGSGGLGNDDSPLGGGAGGALQQQQQRSAPTAA